MFKKKEEIDYANVDTILGKDVHFDGIIKGKGILRVDGKLSGKIIQNGDVIIGEGGVVEADIEARHVSVSGTVQGNIEASGLLQIYSNGRVSGDIKVQSLFIGEGAIYKGSCEMDRSFEQKDAKNKDIIE